MSEPEGLMSSYPDFDWDEPDDDFGLLESFSDMDGLDRSKAPARSPVLRELATAGGTSGTASGKSRRHHRH